MSSDVFSKYRLNKIQEQPKKIDLPKDDPFSKYRIGEPNSEEETFPQYLTRNATRIGSRVAETIGGIPGDIQNLIESGVFAGLEGAIGHPVTAELREKARLKSERAPTSSELKNISQKSSKGYTKPKNNYEELTDEYAETVSSLLGPMKFRKALGISALGTAAKKGAELLGAEKGTQDASKLGTMLVASMVNPKGVKQFYTNLYKQAEKLAPEGTFVSGKHLQEKLLSLKKDLEKGTLDRFETKVLEQTNRVLEKIKDGKVDVNHMIASQRSINGVAGDPEFFRRGEHLFPRLQNAVKDTIKTYKNPEFLKKWNNANEAFSGLHESQKMTRFIEKELGNKPIKHAIIAAIAETAGGYPEAIIPTIGGAAAALGTVKGIELTKRILSNKTLRKYYGDVLLSAAKQNSGALLKSAEKLDKKINQ